MRQWSVPTRGFDTGGAPAAPSKPMAAASAAHARVGLQTAPGKGFGDEAVFKACGAELNGRTWALGMPAAYRSGLAEGLAEGMAEGLVEGLAEGLAERLAEGMAEELAERLAEGLVEELAKGLAEGLVKGNTKIRKWESEK